MLLLIEPKSRHSWVDRSFSSAAPRIWNSLPLNLRSCLCTTKLKCLLKTYFMSRTNFVVSVFYRFVFGLTAPWTPSGVGLCTLQACIIIIVITGSWEMSKTSHKNNCLTQETKICSACKKYFCDIVLFISQKLQQVIF